MGLLSVVVPVYNAEKYLGHCIESIIKQLDETDELILVDNGSSDGSGELCSHYAENFQCIKVIYQPCGGVGAARNSGIKVAQGEYVVFVDSDDYVDPDMVSTIKRYLGKRLDIIIFGHARTTDSDFTVKNGSYPDICVYDMNARAQFLRGVFTAEDIILENCAFSLRTVWAKAYRRQFLSQNSLFFDEGVKMGEDLIYMLKVCSLFGSAGCVNRVIYYYFQNDTSFMNRYKPDFREILDSYEEAIKPWLALHPEYRPYYAKDYLINIILYIKYDFFHKENRETKAELRKRMRDTFCNGEYKEYYILSRKNGLLKTYTPAQRITFWLAIYGRFTELECIAKIKYR